jgi:hypothetical protein
MSIESETVTLWRVERLKNCRDWPSDVLSRAEVSADEKWGTTGSEETLLLVGYRRILKSEKQTGVMTRFAKKIITGRQWVNRVKHGKKLSLSRL